jgi:tetratricopeptide (TPR) repeat protein
MKNKCGFLIIAALLILTPRGLHADKPADDLFAKYKDAMAANQVEQALTYLCSAAELDPKKYEKKCTAAKQHANEQLKQFDDFYTAGQAAMQKKDYDTAIKTLGKVTFGTHHADAQHLIQEANSSLNHPQVLAAEKITLGVAQAAYAKGDLTAASTSASQITSAELQAAKSQILTNIKVYQDAMTAGDDELKAGHYAAAQQKFKFAVAVNPNGPGNPISKLQQASIQVDAAAAAKNPATNASTQPTTGTNPKTAASTDQKKDDAPLTGDALKIKTSLADGRTAESKKDLAAALTAYEQVLALNPKQADALAGKQRIMAGMQKSPQGIEQTLAAGLRSYYHSRFVEADDALTLYLTAGGSRNKGVAFFYLGATFATESMLASSTSHEDRILQQRALKQFQQARCEHYNPVEKYLSPKVLAIWSKSSCQA